MRIIENLRNFFNPRIKSVDFLTPVATGDGTYRVVVHYYLAAPVTRVFRDGAKKSFGAYDAATMARQYHEAMVEKMSYQEKMRGCVKS